jgi:glycosyltransferase involved in cell wall biosynthesis
MKSLDERLNGLRWRLEAMRRLWSADAEPDMTFLAPKPPEAGALGKIDHPSPGAEIEAETLAVSGWVSFVDGPASKVEVWLDDELLDRARLALPREDVDETNDHLPYAAVSGFELLADLHRLPAARSGQPSQVRVVATAADGRSFALDPVSVSLTAAKPRTGLRSAPAPVPPRDAGAGSGLRTLVVTHQLNLGGAQLYLMDLLRGLRERGGFDLTVISAKDGLLRERLEEVGIPVHITSTSPHDDLSSHLGRVEELATWAEPRGFELALVNTATESILPGAEVAARLGIPAVWAIHESFEPAVLWANLEPDVRARAEANVGTAAFAIFEAEATQRIYEPLVPPERCRMLPYGLDLEPIDAKRSGFDAAAARRQASLPAAGQLVVCVGTVEPRKAQIPLAQAFELIADRHPDAHLAFVGGRDTDPYSRMLGDAIAASPRGSQMHLIPITPDVDSWYGMADLLVCASDVESLPRTVLEAMAWETPVLATSVFGLPELIEHGKTGWLCESRDIGELAKGLDQALGAGAEQRAAIGPAARALVAERHSLDNYAAEVAALLERAHTDGRRSD